MRFSVHTARIRGFFFSRVGITLYLDQERNMDPIDEFFKTDSQYYIGGRFAAFAWFHPVVGNLFHHAIEMYLKGALSKTRSLSELKRLYHDLRNCPARC